MKKAWKAVTVKDVSGKTPTIYWVTKEGDDVGEGEEIAPEETEADIVARLEARGITKESGKSKILIKPTKTCRAFRVTTLAGKRDKSSKKADKSCEDEIPKGAGVGFCDCRDGTKVTIDNDRNRIPFTCDAVCSAPDKALPWESFAPTPTEHCVAFRSKKQGGDKECGEKLSVLVEGECECTEGKPIKLAKQDGKKKEKFTCDEKCKARAEGTGLADEL